MFRVFFQWLHRLLSGRCSKTLEEGESSVPPAVSVQDELEICKARMLEIANMPREFKREHSAEYAVLQGKCATLQKQIDTLKLETSTVENEANSELLTSEQQLLEVLKALRVAISVVTPGLRELLARELNELAKNNRTATESSRRYTFFVLQDLLDLLGRYKEVTPSMQKEIEHTLRGMEFSSLLKYDDSKEVQLRAELSILQKLVKGN